ncbi:hypothetical protein BH11ACT8_BH11ACT8_33600 [soil metagenome]
MLILGLLLIVAGAGVILAGLFTTDVSSTGQIQVIGIDVSAQTLFVLGILAAVAILWGFTIGKLGAKRGMRQRREQKKIDDLSAKLDRAEGERNRDLDDKDDRDRDRNRRF